MSTDDDEDALTWAGARDPSHFETPVAPATPAQPRIRKSRKSGLAAAADGPTHEQDATNQQDDQQDDQHDDQPDDEHAPTTFETVASGAVLVSLGILGGIYLLYTIGWIVSLQRLYYIASTELDQLAFVAQQYLAIVAPAAWFVAAMFFTRHHRPVVRLIWLIVGAVVLVPWPFVLGS